MSPENLPPPGVGGMELAFVADPASAAKISFNVGPRFNFPVFASSSLSAETILCVALPALCAVINPAPLITVSGQATVQLDSAPAAGGLISGDSTVAADVRSFWQSDTIGVRLRR